MAVPPDAAVIVWVDGGASIENEERDMIDIFCNDELSESCQLLSCWGTIHNLDPRRAGTP